MKDIRTKVMPASRQHEDLRNGFIAAIRKTAPDMPADEILAVVCVFVGQLIAMQDQRRFTSDSIMKLVAYNIERGNQTVIEDLFKAQGGNG
ncbi:MULTISPECIES: hypothetical protein [unclassified Mesorhizobium]|uniref:hypothetical protein n=1 Tax=unclassified Mesorhizobium TaxID=325217 RepID=UPI000FCC3207|nr:MULTISPECIES: hypothetical protein [unclassified Mesorhizobium]RUU54267.1 hypothetical protein EOC99_29650 [Mesorhizobium sp. M7A.T.Ca.TU.009.01.1.1]RUU83235.1 hypothetical protein EOD03_15610 [Mesorhizobium sp. M7A.T.Ca.TU.009.01.1.2]RUT80998.1 hypothetical protein EOD15_33800 [Mesorhizobium sp. M7A.T.Ca.US.000.02.2.1]RUT84261.1 hypothetical protein EOD14_21450 [Mesorhizobium sp. M7A.T.Ca.US.000.02.1.1]RUT96599.1 hypothetical protein EOD12_29595 [Mesorhizobium sp. M7A.T.Ca.TU.009.02.1.1]